MIDTYTMKYWESRGSLSEKLKIIHEKYIIGAEYNKIIESKNIKANPKIRRLMQLSNKMYRFYNDGDSFVYKGELVGQPRGEQMRRFKISYERTNKLLKKIEGEIDKLVKDVWILTKRATI